MTSPQFFASSKYLASPNTCKNKPTTTYDMTPSVPHSQCFSQCAAMRCTVWTSLDVRRCDLLPSFRTRVCWLTWHTVQRKFYLVCFKKCVNPSWGTMAPMHKFVTGGAAHGRWVVARGKPQFHRTVNAGSDHCVQLLSEHLPNSHPWKVVGDMCGNPCSADFYSQPRSPKINRTFESIDPKFSGSYHK